MGKVRQAADRFRALGARVDEISVPEHYLAVDCWTAITVEGLQDGMMHGNSTGSNYRGLFVPLIMDHIAQWRSSRSTDVLERSLCPHSVNSASHPCCTLHEWLVLSLRGSTEFYADAALSTLRACAAEKPNSHNGRRSQPVDATL
jgi:hypothetical protein